MEIGIEMGMENEKRSVVVAKTKCPQNYRCSAMGAF